jgi:hypothetical protein
MAAHGKHADDWRWWLIALLPRFAARWIWLNEWIPLGSWTPYVLGQSMGVRGQRVEQRGGM